MELATLIKSYPSVDLASLATFTVECEPDESPIRGNFASGDDEQDRTLEDELISRSNSGDTWAWCSVRVHATIGELTVQSDWLGGCSYESEADYRANSGYFDDQKHEALQLLEAEVKSAVIVGGTGEVFTRHESQTLASLIYKRFGRDAEAGAAAWRRLLQNNASTADFMALVTAVQ